ncbi:MAG TPA: PDZ domain-containing protein, partial [Bacteroidetes bacterium]|nr:PDZ domain-containing protein [Bacteroidota bacterium]
GAPKPKEVEVTTGRERGVGSDDMIIRPKSPENPVRNSVPKVVSRAFMGVHYEMVYGKAMGSHINTVVRNTPAERAGLKSRDVITAVDGERLLVLDDLARIVQRHKPGERVVLSILREGRMRKIPVILGEKKEVYFSPNKGDLGLNYRKDLKGANEGRKLKMERPFLGVSFMRTESRVEINGREIQRTEAGDDLLVTEVLNNSTAEAMGLRGGDRITAINGEKLAGFAALTAKMRTLVVGDPVLLEFERDGQMAIANGMLRGRPDNMQSKLRVLEYGKDGRLKGDASEVELSGSIHKRVKTLMRQMNSDSYGMNSEVEVRLHLSRVSDAEAQALSWKSGQRFVAVGSLAVRDLDLAPNPNGGRFSLSFSLSKAGPVQLRVLDSSGNRVYAETLRSENKRYHKEFDLRKRVKGVYFLQISQSGQAFSRKIISE